MAYAIAGGFAASAAILCLKRTTCCDDLAHSVQNRVLRDFKELARDFGKAKNPDIERMLALGELMEICDG
ncbi:hypothetical protein DWV00_02170 [Trinickia dinghuensis]|uniref:Uncharacterized protein n=1 Tax=Trinickia dinghuensis TaxID=2291023 RepID=A0A3D8K6S7_9BURK|nr:hypothetical protein DWV00_02170 [Trinickia dinghuensis]